MESFPLFFRVRAIAFTCMMLLSFLWLVLLCIETFARWDVSDQISRSLMILFILANSITLIMLPILILVEFRVWLDTARLFLLFILQVGSAASGSYWTPRIQCPNQTSDDIGVCQLIGVYTMMACWVTPAILIFYSAYFAVIVYLQSRIPVVVKPEHRSGVDLETGFNDSLWRGKSKAITAMQSSSPDTISPRSPLFPSTAHAGPSQSHLPTFQGRPLPNTPYRQSTIPSLSHASQQSFPGPVLTSVPTRHQSLPAFKQSNASDLCPLSIPLPVPTEVSLSQPQTPSLHTFSPSSSGSHSFNSRPGVTNVRFGNNDRWRSRHFSMMPSSSSPREMHSAEGSLTTPSSSRTRLSKSIGPSHIK